MNPLSFPKAARRLLDVLLSVDLQQEEEFESFYNMALGLIGRVDSMRWSEKEKPGYEEWCEFRAEVMVSWPLYYYEGDLKLPLTGEHYRPDISATKGLLEEVLGLRTRKGRERWLTRVERRSRMMTQGVTTKGDFKEKLRCLLDPDSLHQPEYQAIYQQLHAEVFGT